MNIEVTKHHLSTIESIPEGGVFIFDKMAFIKTNRSSSAAVRLADGEDWSLNPTALVEVPVSAVINIVVL